MIDLSFIRLLKFWQRFSSLETVRGDYRLIKPQLRLAKAKWQRRHRKISGQASAVLQEFVKYAKNGFEFKGLIESPIKGKGNRNF